MLFKNSTSTWRSLEATIMLDSRFKGFGDFSQIFFFFTLFCFSLFVTYVGVSDSYQRRLMLSMNELEALVDRLQNEPPAISPVYPVRFQRCATFGADFRVELSHWAPSPPGARIQHDFHTCLYIFKWVMLGRRGKSRWKCVMGCQGVERLIRWIVWSLSPEGSHSRVGLSGLVRPDSS